MKYADRKGLRFALTPDASGAIHGKDLRSGETFDSATAADAAAEVHRRGA
jgi:hypothetical protein